MATTPLNILAVSGSLRQNSSNHSILQYIAGLTPAGTNFTIYEGIDALPHFNPTNDVEDAPAEVARLRQAIAEADAVIICSPEYAFGVPGSLKNALDWTVSSGSFNQKPVTIITASSSGDKAHAALLHIFTALGAVMAPGANLLIPYVRTKVSVDGQVTHKPTQQALAYVLQALLAALAQQGGVL